MFDEVYAQGTKQWCRQGLPSEEKTRNLVCSGLLVTLAGLH